MIRYRSGGVRGGEFLLSVWKTNNKVRGVCAKVRVVSFLDISDILLARNLELGLFFFLSFFLLFLIFFFLIIIILFYS